MKKFRPKSRIGRCLFFLGILGIVLGVVGGGLVMQMNNEVYGEGFKSGRNDEWPYSYPTPRAQQAGYDQKLAEVLDRYPELRPQWRSVADEENGFLQLFDLFEYVIGADGAEMEYGVTFSTELRKELSSDISEEGFGDGKRFSGLIDELGRIAELEEQSCAGVDPERLFFHPPEAIYNFTNILLFDAKSAADAGDKKRALSSIRTAVKIGVHFSQVETLSLNGIIVATQLEKSILETTLYNLLPILDLEKEDYKVWRKVINDGRADIGPEKVSIGEFNVAFPALAIPISERVWLFQLSGVDRIYDAMAQCHLELIRSSSGGGKKCLETFRMEKALSDKIEESPYVSRRLVRVLHAGLPSFIKTVTRASARFRYYDAALAKLAGEELPLELITEKSFVLDVEKQILTIPDDPLLKGFQFEPIGLSFASE